MSESTKLTERKPTELVREKTQYAIAFGVIAVLLFLTNFPWLVIGFFGILSFFIWKTLTSTPPGGTREIFEFYLQANDILRDDDRRWYGFEVHEVISRGERIVHQMKNAPPLVHFALGALYHKIGDYRLAEQNLAYVGENEAADERAFVHPTPELRAYVKTLRKIEREPSDAPLTSTAVRALERARRNRTAQLLESSRDALRQLEFKQVELELDGQTTNGHAAGDELAPVSVFAAEREAKPRKSVASNERNPAEVEEFGNRKTISEVLRDIYDTK